MSNQPSPTKSNRTRTRSRSSQRGTLATPKSTSSNMTAEEVAQRLAAPTRDVSVEDLQKQYYYVVNDLRSMGILALVLVIVLLGLGFGRLYI